MLVEIINLDPETGLQNVLHVKRPVQEAYFIALAKKISKPWT